MQKWCLISPETLEDETFGREYASPKRQKCARFEKKGQNQNFHDKQVEQNLKSSNFAQKANMASPVLCAHERLKANFLKPSQTFQAYDIGNQ